MTLPGLLTALAGLLTAIGGLLAVLCQVGVICGDEADGVDIQQVTVPATRELTATPFTLNPGDFVTIDAEGEVFDDLSGHPSRSFSPEGVPDPKNEHPGDPLKPANHAALIGKVGEEGELFEIGRAISFESTSSGRVFLSINDGRFTDNGGEYVAPVRVERG